MMTGSSSRILKDGTSDAGERKEYEPLGQEFLPVDPDETEPTIILGERQLSVDEPECLCGLS